MMHSIVYSIIPLLLTGFFGLIGIAVTALAVYALLIGIKIMRWYIKEHDIH